MRNFQRFIGVMMVLTGVAAIIAGVGEGMLFIVAGLYVVLTKDNAIGPMKGDNEDGRY